MRAALRWGAVTSPLRLQTPGTWHAFGEADAPDSTVTEYRVSDLPLTGACSSLRVLLYEQVRPREGVRIFFHGPNGI